MKNHKKSNGSSNLIAIISCLLIVGIIVISCFLGSGKNNISYTLEINGDNSVVVYKGNAYNDLGAKAYDSEQNDLSAEVSVINNVNTNKTGKYEITYTLGDMSVKRIVRVIDKPGENNSQQSGETQKNNQNTGETVITLKGEETVYIDLYGNYKEEGFTAVDSKDGNIKKKVKVTHNVDNSTPGVYEVVYTAKNSSGITTSVKRQIVVMNVKMTLSVLNTGYTNGTVGIKADIVDEYFDYLVLPNGQTVVSKSYTYDVSENGTYKFKLMNKHGAVREAEIEVKNIDKVAPVASCSAEYRGGKTIIKVDASDNVGVKKYVTSGKTYTTNTLTVDSLVTNNTVYVYDAAGNEASTNCIVNSRVYIESVKRDGVIVTVKAGNINSSIAGYYFSYNNVVPSKSTGQFIATSSETLDVVRLSGTTYVWVEDGFGNVSEAGTVSVPNDALLITYSGYKKLENMSLEAYLSANGWSKTEFDKLIARSVRAAGVYSKNAAATAGVAMQTVLAQKYKIKMPYWWGGKSWAFGADKSWGIAKSTYSEEYDVHYYYYGLDCSGFATWAYVNAGYDINRGQYPSFWSYSKSPLSKESGEVGDFILSSGHVKLIVGKTDTGFICAEAAGKGPGMCLSNHPYSKSSGFWIAKGEGIANKYPKESINNIPTGI